MKVRILKSKLYKIETIQKGFFIKSYYYVYLVRLKTENDFELKRGDMVKLGILDFVVHENPTGKEAHLKSFPLKISKGNGFIDLRGFDYIHEVCITGSCLIIK